jgi:hypothetical protein
MRCPVYTSGYKTARPPKLLGQLKRRLRDKRYSLHTEEMYVYWARWFIRFHGLSIRRKWTRWKCGIPVLSYQRAHGISIHA